MFYDFECKECSHHQVLSFLGAEYDEHVHNEEALDGLHRTELCEKCGKKALYRHISMETMPEVLGGTKHYVSMERYWAQNKDQTRRQEDALTKKLQQRHEERVTKNIDKQQTRKGRDDRHKGYGKDGGEQKLSSPD